MTPHPTSHHWTKPVEFRHDNPGPHKNLHTALSRCVTMLSLSMKRVIPYFAIIASVSLVFWPSQLPADELKFAVKGGDSLNNPAAEESFDAEEFVALRFLSKNKGTAFDELPSIEKISFTKAKDYLLSTWFGDSEKNAFETKREVEQLDAALNDANGPCAEANKVDYVKIDVTEHVSKDYDFTKSAFPFTPEAGGRGNSKLSLFDGNEILAIELFAIGHLPISPDKGEKWLTGRGKVFATCKVGKEFNLRQFGIMQAIEVRCEKIVFESKEGDVLTEFNAPAPFEEADPKAPLSKVVPDPASPKVDPVGEWTTKEHNPQFSLCLWESGDARGEFESKGLAIHLEGNWYVIKDGKWKGYVIFSSKVDYWAVDQKDVTPKAENSEFLLSLEGNKLIYIKGGMLTDKNGGKFYPSGLQANDDPILIKQNSPRPVRREPGNH